MPRIEMEALVVPQCLDTSAVEPNSFYKVTSFCSVLWRLSFIDPTADLTQQAAIISDNHQLTWLDFYTISKRVCCYYFLLWIIRKRLG